MLPQFHAFAADSVLVAHNAAFDLAFMRREEARLGAALRPAGARHAAAVGGPARSRLEHPLEAIAARFGLTLRGRHQALGDALGTGQLFLRMLELLEAQGVRTLGAALALAERAGALRRRQAEQRAPRRERAGQRAGQG